MSGKEKDERTWGERVNDYLVNDGPKLVVIIVWLIANVAVMAERYYCTFYPYSTFEFSRNFVGRHTFTVTPSRFQYANIFRKKDRVLIHSDYTVTRANVFSLLGNGVTAARCTAASIKLNSALMLISVLRNMLSW